MFGERLGSAALALFLISQFILSSLYSPFIFIGWFALGVAVICRYLAPNKIERPRWVLWLLIILLGCHAGGVAGAAVWGNGNWVLTAGMVLWMAPLPLVYWVVDHHIRRWLCVFALIHALFIIVQGFTNYHYVESILVWEGNPTGFSHNKNLAAGLLVMCLPLTSNGRWRWASLILLAGVIFTGSRWGAGVGLLLAVAMAARGTIPWRWALGGTAVFIGAVILIGIITPGSHVLAGYNSVGNGLVVLRDIEVRLGTTGWPNLLPYGLAETNGLHNVPLRMATEFGIIAAVIWVGLTAWSLTRQRFSPVWWMMVGIVLLSMLDHYTWRPHLAGFWWVALGVLASTSNSCSRQISRSCSADTPNSST
jgi:hypothetical protein